jgi:hypothetical protein
MVGTATMIDRAQSVTSDDLLSSFFGKAGSMGTLNMPKLGSETDVSGFLNTPPFLMTVLLIEPKGTPFKYSTLINLHL